MPKLLGTLDAAEHSLIALLPLWAMRDRWDIGGLSTNLHYQTGRPTIFVYDGHSGGVGITERGFNRFHDWVEDTTPPATLSVRGRLPLVRAEPEGAGTDQPLDKAHELSWSECWRKCRSRRAAFVIRGASDGGGHVQYMALIYGDQNRWASFCGRVARRRVRAVSRVR